jgi:hypothetical protein
MPEPLVNEVSVEGADSEGASAGKKKMGRVSTH